jgi:RNA polymerase sigma factor (sigma-70 family)
MNAQNNTSPDSSVPRRKQQGEALQQREAKLRRLADQRSKQEFFQQIVPLLQPLKDYIKRRLRIAYLELQIRVPVYTSGDILDKVVLKAYENYSQKPQSLTLEQWLYQLANEKLDRYIEERRHTDARRRSLETLAQTELRALEEPITADAEGEVLLVEDLDDPEYHQREFAPLAKTDSTPEEELEKEEEVEQILLALSHVPEQDRLVFQLFAMEGFPKAAVAAICNISLDEVPRIVKRVRSKVLREIQPDRTSAQEKAKAS